MNVPLGKWSGSDATDRLRETIEHLAKENDRQTRVMLRLTWVMTVLTVVTTIGVVVQIAMAWKTTPVEAATVDK